MSLDRELIAHCVATNTPLSAEVVRELAEFYLDHTAAHLAADLLRLWAQPQPKKSETRKRGRK